MVAPVDHSEGKPIICVTDLLAVYEGRTVLHDVSFDVHTGEILVIAGGSGCGKSTVMKHIIGLYHPAGGSIRIDGDDLHGADEATMDRIRRKFGVAYQGGALFGSMTVLDNVRLPLEEFTDLSSEMIDMIALTKLKVVGLEDAAQRMPSELSGGMQKRAALARAIALDPRIVFLDEPSAGLDPVTSADLDQLILSLNRMLNTTFVIVTHELASIFTVADRVIVLDAAAKTVVAVGAPATLRDTSDDPRVRAFFNRQASVTDAAAPGSAQPDALSEDTES